MYLGRCHDIMHSNTREVEFQLDKQAKILAVDMNSLNEVKCLLFYPTYSGEGTPVQREYRRIRLGFLNLSENIYEALNLGHDDDLVYLGSIGHLQVVLITDEVKGLIHG